MDNSTPQGAPGATHTAAVDGGQPVDREPVHVFGSNMRGEHRTGAAAIAARVHGAEDGVWRGPTGNAYAIPDRNADDRLLPLAELARHVASLRQYAASKPEIALRVARFACGRGEYLDREVAPLFARMPPNCALPGLWRRVLDPDQPARLLVCDPEGRLREPEWQDALRRYLALNLPLWGATGFELISVGGARSIVAADAAARRFRCRHRIFAENPARYGREAAVTAEMAGVWAATHLLAICDPDQTANPGVVRILTLATREGLPCEELAVDGVPAGRD